VGEYRPEAAAVGDGMDRFGAGWQAADVLRRCAAVAVLALTLGGCEVAQLVDCEPGRFARAGGDSWCVYGPRDTVRCPRLLPVEHDLPWGGRGCSSEQHSPLPAELCAAAGECQPDGGAGEDGG
jgi:hypothetical protein